MRFGAGECFAPRGARGDLSAPRLVGYVWICIVFGLSPIASAWETIPLAARTDGECVVLLHGLARTARSMERLARRARDLGYRTVNQDYASRSLSIEALAEQVLPTAIAGCGSDPTRIHFVTHSMGGILVRQFLSRNEVPGLGRVVMLSPPNQGSEVVDSLGWLPPFHWLNGPAGGQLGTGRGSLPLALGAVSYDVGVITGDRTINPLLSLIIPGPDDGKVSVDRARVEGMKDFLVVQRTHPLIMRAEEVILQSFHFIRHGRFREPAR